jgi:protein-tyrosine phosphatase
LSASHEPADVFDVVFVCTGNICRSPMAEFILVKRLDEVLPQDAARFRVHSAGTYGLHDYPIDPRAARAIGDLGIDASTFRARELTDQMLADADVVLTATRDHRATAVTMSPRSSRKTFTTREFGRLCAGVDPAQLPAGDPVLRGREVVRSAGNRRGLEPASYDDDEIADPYGARQADFGTSVRLIEESLRPFVTLLAPR